VADEDVEVCVEVEDGQVGPNGDAGDQAVDQLPDRLAPATAGAVQRRTLVIISRLGRNEGGPSQESPEVVKVTFVTGAGENFHTDWLANGDLPAQKLIDSDAHRAAGVPQKLHPG
jgi:hypothetical protein